MKNFVYLVAGICAAAAALVVFDRSRPQPVEELAHRLEAAWADNHTVV